MINRLVFGLAYKRADLILTQARYYVDKLRRLYGVDSEGLLPPESG
ncbi:MAG: hypothetical protein RXQ95_07220 [Vulcanisaeta sp.]